MNRILSVLCLSVLLTLVASGCGSDPIDVVKKGTLPADPSITIGKAFDSYDYYKNPRWELAETERGQEMVVFMADIPPDLYPGYGSLYDDDFEFFFRVVFMMNTDGKGFYLKGVLIGSQPHDLEPVSAILANRPSETVTYVLRSGYGR